MNYKGNLYGKIGSGYIPLVMTSEEVDKMQAELSEAWNLLSVLSANMMDDGHSWPRVLEWLKRNESFRPKNNLEQ